MSLALVLYALAALVHSWAFASIALEAPMLLVMVSVLFWLDPKVQFLSSANQVFNPSLVLCCGLPLITTIFPFWLAVILAAVFFPLPTVNADIIRMCFPSVSSKHIKRAEIEGNLRGMAHKNELIDLVENRRDILISHLFEFSVNKRDFVAFFPRFLNDREAEKSTLPRGCMILCEEHGGAWAFVSSSGFFPKFGNDKAPEKLVQSVQYSMLLKLSGFLAAFHIVWIGWRPVVLLTTKNGMSDELISMFSEAFFHQYYWWQLFLLNILGVDSLYGEMMHPNDNTHGTLAVCPVWFPTKANVRTGSCLSFFAGGGSIVMNGLAALMSSVGSFELMWMIRVGNLFFTQIDRLQDGTAQIYRALVLSWVEEYSIPLPPSAVDFIGFLLCRLSVHGRFVVGNACEGFILRGRDGKMSKFKLAPYTVATMVFRVLMKKKDDVHKTVVHHLDSPTFGYASNDNFLAQTEGVVTDALTNKFLPWQVAQKLVQEA